MGDHKKQPVLYLLLTLVVLSEAQDAFTTLPKNTQGVIGQNVTLNCALAVATNSLIWRNPTDVSVYEKGNGILDGFEGQYHVEEGSSNSYNLVILNTDLNDAGRYTCYCGTQSSSAFAEVILLRNNDESKGMTCAETTNTGDNDFGNMVPDEEIKLTCETTYYGLWGPTQMWTNSREETLEPSDISVTGRIIFENSETLTVDDNNLLWKVDSYFPEPPIGDDGIPAEDETEPPTSYYNRERPSWNEVYDSTPIIVYYPVTNMNLGNVEEEYNPGEEITCAAEGNPDPDISWVDDNNDTVVESNVLTIEASMEGTRTYSCLATNVVRGETNSEMQTITFNVTIVPTTPPTTMPDSDEGTGNPGDGSTTASSGERKDGGSGLSDGAIAGIVIGVIVFLVILAIILFFCCVRKAPQKKTEKTKPIAPVATIPTDHIRAGPPKPADNLSYVSEKPPPSPYNPYNPYAIPNSHHHSPSPYEANNLHYADLALDDTPRSRKPIQVYEPTDYADIRRV